jgi:hypothetical protein
MRPENFIDRPIVFQLFRARRAPRNRLRVVSARSRSRGGNRLRRRDGAVALAARLYDDGLDDRAGAFPAAAG